MRTKTPFSVTRLERRLAVLASLMLVLALPGCGPREPVTPEKLMHNTYAAGDNQCGMHGEALAKPFQVLVQGAQERGILGGKGSRKPVANHEVTFAVEDPETGAVFVESGEPVHTALTNAAGMASATLKLGRWSGDVNVVASTETASGTKSVLFRAASGVELIGRDLEGVTGGEIEEIGVILRNPSGEPAEGVPVYFHVEGDSKKAKVGTHRTETDADGRAVTSLTLGTEVSRNFVSVEVQDNRQGIPPEARFHMRAIQFEAMATNKPMMLLTLFGGLAVFIFGMRLMSEGLQRMADRRLKSILQAMTRNRFLATGVGAMLTAMVQSSSATTVMVVGFVNAGLITLTQAIGVIYGANIGTTITAQIIAFKLDALAYPAIAVGLVMMGVSRKPFMKSMGEAIMGFGLLFLGMSTMSGILKPLRYSPEFVSLFQAFDCTPVGGQIPYLPALMSIIIGAVATCIVQSSSASVGLVLALSSQGLLSFYTAVPLILGTNIGTTITALLASIGTRRNARRAAIAHTLFNVLGSAYMYVLLYVPIWNGQPVFLGFINEITPGDAFAAVPENLVRHVANAHTAFNIFNCLLFLPFVGLMARICQRIIPLTGADCESVLQYLEPHLLQTPTLALRQAVYEVVYMLRRAQKSFNESCEFFFTGERDLERKVLEREDVIDRLQREVTGYLVELSRKNLPPDEATLIPALIHAVNDAERVGDHSEEMLELTHLRKENKQELSATAEDEIRQFENLLNEQFEATRAILEASNGDTLDDIVAREEQLSKLLRHATESHTKRLETGECSVQSGVIFLDFLTHLERIGDHLLNIAERAGVITQVVEGERAERA